MSEQENETTQQERDAATLATIREFMDVTKEYDNAQDGHSIRDGTRALLRTIDRLTAERDQARAECDAFEEIGQTISDAIHNYRHGVPNARETLIIISRAIEQWEALASGESEPDHE